MSLRGRSPRRSNPPLSEEIASLSLAMTCGRRSTCCESYSPLRYRYGDGSQSASGEELVTPTVPARKAGGTPPPVGGGGRGLGLSALLPSAEGATARSPRSAAEWEGGAFKGAL
jgi:hypothetical protein